MHYYVGVRVPEGMALVTHINPADQSIDFKLHKRPIEFTEAMAYSIMNILCERLYQAVVIISKECFFDHPFAVCYR